MPQFIDNTDWSKVEGLNSTAFSGFNVDDFVTKDLKEFVKQYGTEEMEFGFCPRGRAPDDLNKWADVMTSVGWKFLTIENFGLKNLKGLRDQLPLRFHPTVDDDGRLRYRNRWIMYMRKSTRDAQMNAQAENAYRQFAEMQKGFEPPSMDEARAAKGLAPGDERVAAFGSPLEMKKMSASDFAKEKD